MQGESREIQVPVLEALAHSEHIRKLQLYCSGNPLADVAGETLDVRALALHCMPAREIIWDML